LIYTVLQSTNKTEIKTKSNNKSKQASMMWQCFMVTIIFEHVWNFYRLFFSVPSSPYGTFFWLQNLIRSSAVDGEYSLSVSSKLFKPFMW